MRTPRLLVITAWVVLFTFSFSCLPTAALAADDTVVIMDTPTAQKLDGDLKYYKDTLPKLQQQINGKDADIQKANTEIKLLTQKSGTLMEDLKKMTIGKEEYKALYEKADNERLKAVENAPSRMTWFTVGAVSTTIVGVLVLLLAKK